MVSGFLNPHGRIILAVTSYHLYKLNLRITESGIVADFFVFILQSCDDISRAMIPL